MSEEYHHQSVHITIPKHSNLYQRIEAKAAADGVSVEFVVNMLMMVGTYELMEKRMDIMEGK